MSGIQVARGQEKINNPLSAYSTESTDKPEYVTGQEVGGKKRAMDVVVYGTYSLSTANVIAAIGTSLRTITKVAHGARKNDVVSFTSGLMAGVAIQILSCPTADIMILAATPENLLAVGDTFDIKRYISPQYNPDGSLSVSTIPTNVQFDLNGVDTVVVKDTAVPANSRGLPVEEIQKQMSETVFFDYTGVSNAGYTQLIAATLAKTKSFTWFESSGQPMVVAIGAPAAEIDLFVVPPGGFNGEIPIPIPAGSRVSIKQLNAIALGAGIMLVANLLK